VADTTARKGWERKRKFGLIKTRTSSTKKKKTIRDITKSYDASKCRIIAFED
jgi:hypothetical protein